MKKLITIILTLSLIITTIPTITSSAEDPTMKRIYCDDEGLADMIDKSVLYPYSTLEIYGEGITDFSPLAQLPKLRELWLTSSNCDMESLSKFQNLEKLYLRNVEITEPLFFTKLPSSLKEVIVFWDDNDWMGGKWIESAGAIKSLTGIESLTNLETLVLDEHGMDLSSLELLAKLPNLKFLSISDKTLISELDLSHFESLVNLEVLMITGLGILTLEQAIALKAALPDCWIRNGYFLFRNIFDAPYGDGVLSINHVLGSAKYTIFDALEILKYLVGMHSNIDESEVSRYAATITDESKVTGEPTILDALEILKYLVGMPGVLLGDDSPDVPVSKHDKQGRKLN